MQIELYQIDAFTSEVFKGNPAAVCPLEKWLPDKIMQSIALENNLSETAFFVPEGDGFHLRWFTPKAEVDLCGHATLASAFALFEILGYAKDEIKFASKSGELIVKKEGNWLVMNFPSQPGLPCEASNDLIEGLGKTPTETQVTDDYLAVFESEADILAIQPDFERLKRLGGRGVIITAKGEEVDFVSRFFAPNVGINEDPVTGSAHCKLTPFWAEKIRKTKFTARQLSQRGGELRCELAGERVLISGKAVLYLQGKIFIPG
jgi:PhzF family phenazine biosynthesis protein